MATVDTDYDAKYKKVELLIWMNGVNSHRKEVLIVLD